MAYTLNDQLSAQFEQPASSGGKIFQKHPYQNKQSSFFVIWTKGEGFLWLILDKILWFYEQVIFVTLRFFLIFQFFNKHQNAIKRLSVI